MHSHICIWYYGAYFSTQPACVEDTDTSNGADNETHRVELAWRVCVTANFLTGLINIFLGFFGQLLMSLFPVGAFFSFPSFLSYQAFSSFRSFLNTCWWCYALLVALLYRWLLLQAAMLIPLAGIGFTWLPLNQIAPNFGTTAIGLIPVWLIFTQCYGFGRFHLRNGWYMPEALPIVMFGIIAVRNPPFITKLSKLCVPERLCIF